MFKLQLIFVTIFVLIIDHNVTAVCNVCNPNGMACINENEFHPCIDGNPITSMKFSCLGENEICTKNGRVCMDKTLESALPACGDTTNCGKCESEQDDGKFTCTSRTTFTMCSGGQLSEIRDSCAENQMCDIGLAKQGQYPCVPSCKESQIEFCDLNDAIDLPITTTEAPKTTSILPTTTEKNTSNETETTEKIASTTLPPLPTTTQNPVQLVCSQQSTVGRYPHPIDTSCKTYIYCFPKSGTMQTTVLRCPGELYFDPSTTVCGKVKPIGCS